MTRRFHDIGGLPGEALDPAGHATERWGVEVTATFGALMRRRLVRLDEIRRAVEDLGAERYDALGYFERQTQATVDVLVEKGILTRAEIERRIADLRRDGRE
jgi:hypothetical protein